MPIPAVPVTSVFGTPLPDRDEGAEIGGTATVAAAVTTAFNGAIAVQAGVDFARFLPVTINLAAVAPPTGNDRVAVQAALTALNAAGGGLLRVPRGTWTFTGATGLSLANSTNPILIEAEDGAVFDFTGSTAATALTLGGSAGSSAALGANVSKGAEAITCALAVAPGDVILLTSTVNWETFTSQKQGEYAEVLSVSGGTINLKGGLFDTYTAATTTVTKMNMPKVSITGRLQLLRNGNVAGIEVAYARDVLLDGIYAEGARERLIYLHHCYQATISNCSGRDFWYSGTGTSYGLAVSASQHVREIGNDFRGGRHAIAHGGVVPSRDIQIIGGAFDNYHASGQKSVDFHADCEYIRIVGATILNGLNSQASNLYVGGGTTIRAVGPVSAVEIGPARSCDYIKFDGVDIESLFPDKDGLAYISGNGANATTLGLLQINATIRSTGTPLRFAAASAADTGATIARVSCSGDWYTGSIGGYGCATALKTGGVAEIVINSFSKEKAGRWRSDFGDGAVFIGNKVGKASFSGEISVGKAYGHPLHIDKFSDLTIENATLITTGTPDPSTIACTGILRMSNVVLDAAGIYADSPREAWINNVTTVNNPAASTLPGMVFESADIYGNKVASATAVPTKAVWKIGDWVKNRSVTAAGSPGWSVTTAGGASSAAWAASTAYALGLWIRATTGGRVWEVTTAGTSDATEPASFSSGAVGATVVDGTVTWTCRATAQAVFKTQAVVAA